MPSRYNVLARLFRRTDNDVIAALYSHALNRPLFVEPRIGEALLGAYMAGDVEYSGEPRKHNAGKIAVINISGALASRPMPGPSGEGPANYEQLTAVFNEAMADDSVDAVVLRLDTPGGFAAGLFDFTDHVFESRGVKPIHAVVDDMAYSAGYAIAAAAEEIWVSRTAGVGSVGVVAYHIDQSAADEQDGVKVTAIYAGAQKIDFSPHFPLSDEAKEREQTEVDRLYGLFAESVARYRGIDLAAVKATEAGLFHGAGALEAGFADRLGTFQHALAHLSGTEVESEDLRQERVADEAATKAAAVREAERVTGAVTKAVLAADLPPALATLLLKAELDEESVGTRIEHAKAVIDLCASAKLDDKASDFVSKHTSIDDVRTSLLEQKAAAEPEIITALPTVTGQAGDRRPSAWDKTITKLGGNPQ